MSDEQEPFPPGTLSSRFQMLVEMPVVRKHHDSQYSQPQGTGALRLSELIKSYYRTLLKEARKRLRLGEIDMAVVISQSASEMCTEWIFINLYALRDSANATDPIAKLSKNIFHEKTHRVFVTLSGDDPEEQPFWDRLKKHYGRRNALCHEGKQSSAEDAADSVAVVDEYIRHVETVVASLQEKWA